ncbi:RES family NAD+ phosphorylase [Caballeronia mineralivorans]|uniref:RES family NAD+ phosphorylase n=1 Tax=Caballeronia mineralivorans TaxID=2010198 RepID=UPI00069EB66D|nr:RES family NAD+ phosphorylase [Caballeronia mineralivorans]
MARILKAPDLDKVRNIALKVINVETKRLIRISSHQTGEPYFGRAANHRFDDPEQIYGTCYMGLTLGAAVAESILHDLEPVNGGYDLTPDKVCNTFAHSFSGAPVRIADLTGAPLSRLGAHAEISTPVYDITMLWSRAIFEHPDAVDGFQYMSRLYTNRKAVVLFDRGTSGAIAKASSVPLYRHSRYASVVKDLAIRMT